MCLFDTSRDVVRAILGVAAEEETERGGAVQAAPPKDLRHGELIEVDAKLFSVGGHWLAESWMRWCIL